MLPHVIDIFPTHPNSKPIVPLTVNTLSHINVRLLVEIFFGDSFDVEFPPLSIFGCYRVIRATWRELQGGGDGGEVTGMYHGFRKFRPSGVALEAIRNEVGQKLAPQNKLNLGSPDDLRLCSMHFWAPWRMC